MGVVEAAAEEDQVVVVPLRLVAVGVLGSCCGEFKAEGVVGVGFKEFS